MRKFSNDFFLLFQICGDFFQILCQLFPALLTTLDVFRRLSLFVFVLLAMQHKFCLVQYKTLLPGV
jgi:hypothetical protein